MILLRPQPHLLKKANPYETINGSTWNQLSPPSADTVSIYRKWRMTNPWTQTSVPSSTTHVLASTSKRSTSTAQNFLSISRTANHVLSSLFLGDVGFSTRFMASATLASIERVNPSLQVLSGHQCEQTHPSGPGTALIANEPRSAGTPFHPLENSWSQTGDLNTLMWTLSLSHLQTATGTCSQWSTDLPVGQLQSPSGTSPQSLSATLSPMVGLPHSEYPPPSRRTEVVNSPLLSGHNYSPHGTSPPISPRPITRRQTG